MEYMVDIHAYILYNKMTNFLDKTLKEDKMRIWLLIILIYSFLTFSQDQIKLDELGMK